MAWGKDGQSLAVGWDIKKWSFWIPNSSDMAGNDEMATGGDSVGFEPSSTSQFISREVPGVMENSSLG